MLPSISSLLEISFLLYFLWKRSLTLLMKPALPPLLLKTPWECLAPVTFVGIKIHLRAIGTVNVCFECFENTIVFSLAFFQEFFEGESIVMHISFVMLIFLLFSDEILGGQKSLMGANCFKEVPCSPSKKARLLFFWSLRLLYQGLPSKNN